MGGMTVAWYPIGDMAPVQARMIDLLQLRCAGPRRGRGFRGLPIRIDELLQLRELPAEGVDLLLQPVGLGEGALELLLLAGRLLPELGEAHELPGRPEPVGGTDQSL